MQRLSSCPSTAFPEIQPQKAHFEILCDSRSGLARETTPTGAKKVESGFRRKASELSCEAFVISQMAGAINWAEKHVGTYLTKGNDRLAIIKLMKSMLQMKM